MTASSVTGTGNGSAENVSRSINISQDINSLKDLTHRIPPIAQQIRWGYWLMGASSSIVVPAGESRYYIVDGADDNNGPEFHRNGLIFYDPINGIIRSENMFDTLTTRISFKISYSSNPQDIELKFLNFDDNGDEHQIIIVTKRFFLDTEDYMHANVSLFTGPNAFRHGIKLRITNPGSQPVTITEGQIFIKEG